MKNIHKFFLVFLVYKTQFFLVHKTQLVYCLSIVFSQFVWIKPSRFPAVVLSLAFLSVCVFLLINRDLLSTPRMFFSQLNLSLVKTILYHATGNRLFRRAGELVRASLIDSIDYLFYIQVIFCTLEVLSVEFYLYWNHLHVKLNLFANFLHFSMVFSLNV